MANLIEKNIVWLARLTQKKQIAKRTWEFTVQIESDGFSFVAGQYVWVNLKEMSVPDVHGSRRAFSVCSTPDAKALQIISRESDSGYSQSLRAIPLGGEVEIIGPFGTSFCLSETDENKLILVAGGAGVAPFMSLLRTYLPDPAFKRKIVLVALSGAKEETLYLDELQALEKQYSHFQFVLVAGRKFAWDDINPFLSHEGDVWYISGPQGMVDWVYDILIENEIPRSKMVFEHYYPSDKTDIDSLFHKEVLHTDSEVISFKVLRKRLLEKYFPILFFIGGCSSLYTMSVDTAKHQFVLVTLIVAVAQFSMLFVWYVLKKQRSAIRLFLFCLMGITTLYSLYDPTSTPDVLIWLPLFPLASFLFLEGAGIYASFFFLGFVILYVYLVSEGMIHSLSSLDILIRAAISVSISTLIGGIYELIIQRSGTVLDRQYNIARVFEQAVQGSSNHIVFTDKNGIVQFANRGAEKTTGYSFAEMTGNTPRLWGGLQEPSVYKEMWQKKISGEIFTGELINHNKANEKYHVLAHISPILDEHNRVIGHIGTEENITHIKETELAALKNKERFEQMANTISSAFRIYSIDDQKILFASKASESLFQIPLDAFYQNSHLWIERIHKDDQERIQKSFAKMVKEGGQYSIEYRIVKDDGSVRDIRDIGGVVESGSEAGKLVVGEARDITFEKEVDRVKSEFVSLASHQLRTPLAAINWFSEMLLDGDAGKLTKKQKEYVEEVHVGNRRMVELVNALLNTSRLDLGTFLIEPVPTDLAKMSQDVVKELQPMIKTKKIDVVEEYQNTVPLIDVDQKLMRIVFQNYLSNALKYTPEEGHVEIRLSTEGDKVRLAVKDTGYGVPAKQADKIFTRLFRADNVLQKDVEGTGLGLYIVKSIMDQSGGKAWFESVENKGSTFYVELPLTGMKKKEGTKSLE